MLPRRSSMRPSATKKRNAELTACALCPRCCGVNRLAGQRGYCRAGDRVALYRYAPHHGEEPPIAGQRGSGTLFFSRCTLACLYCQNYPWSQEGQGDRCGTDGLTEAMRALARAHCHNWNLVSPTPWLPCIVAALERLCDEGISLPVVYNTSGYERAETLARHASWIDVYLTDLRYAKASTAAEGSRAEDYVEASREALMAMWERLGPLRCDENGVAVSGVVCRLLVLPGHADEAVANLEWMATHLGVDVPISVMAQYHPAYHAAARTPWNRRVTREEYDMVGDAVARLGFESGWIQAYTDAVEDDLVGHRMPQGGFETPVD